MSAEKAEKVLRSAVVLLKKDFKVNYLTIMHLLLPRVFRSRHATMNPAVTATTVITTSTEAFIGE